MGEEGGEGWLGEGMYLCGGGEGVANNHGRRTIHDGNHDCLRNNVHDDYTLYY